MDKCRAALVGWQGDYHSNCPLDQQWLKFAELDYREFRSFVATGATDDEGAAWIGESAKKRPMSLTWKNNVSERSGGCRSPAPDDVVSGATGQQGGAVANALLHKGQRIRVMTRSLEKAAALAKAGAEVAKGDLTNQADLQAALRGVHGVFAMSTPFEAGMEAEVKQGVMQADAAKQAGVAHYVYTSVGSAHRHTGIPHFDSKWKVEQHIEKIGLPATILRPVFFMENFTTFAKPSPDGVLTMPMRPESKLAMVALRDIGEFGAEAFIRPKDFLGQAVDLAGDELTIPQAATFLTKATERSIRFQEFPLEQAETAMGHDFATMFRWFNDVGYTIDIPALKQKFGIPLTTFQEWVSTIEWSKAQ